MLPLSSRGDAMTQQVFQFLLGCYLTECLDIVEELILAFNSFWDATRNPPRGRGDIEWLSIPFGMLPSFSVTVHEEPDTFNSFWDAT